jgi:hypothetical protein
MAKIEEMYVRKTRDELGRYPTWPVQREISLGMIGFLNGRKATFDWKTSLGNLGINIEPLSSSALKSDLYTSLNSVEFSFNVSSANIATAAFSFSKKFSVAIQGYNVSFQTIPIGDLENELNANIKNGSIAWDSNWVILTEIWITQAFTTLISSKGEGFVEISTNKPVSIPSFNIADVSLELSISKSKSMGYLGIAEAGVKPFFQIHKLIYDKKRKQYLLKRYG